MWVRSILDCVTAPSNRSATRAANRRNAARRLWMESLEGRSLLAVVASNDVYAAVEDTPLVVAAPGVLDNDTDPNNADLSAILVDNPGHGTLSLNSDGSFSYTPNVNFFGTDTFTYQASDGQADSNIAAVTINVTPVNDPPFGANGTVTMAEDTLYALSVADFGFLDLQDAPPNSFLAVRITTVPAAGTLTVFGFPLSPGQVVPVSSIASGQLRFIPGPNASGLPYASFTFQVQDDGGTANGGVDFDPSPNTLTINVSSVNDPPFGANGTVTMAEDTLYAFTVADFGFIDPQDAPPNSLQAVRITTLPTAGMLTVFGFPASPGQFVPVPLIVSGQMRFIPAINASGLPYASFTFQVQDDGGTANGGNDLDPSPNTLTINVSPVNDPPFGANGTVTMAEDTLYALSVADFGFIDPLDAPPNSFLAVRITTLPAAGTLTVFGIPAGLGQVVPVSSIASGQLRFIPAANAHGVPYASFAFQVRDNGGTADGGVDLDPVPNTLTINVSSVNDPPFGIDGTVTVAEDTLYTFQVADFNFIDPADFPPNSLAAVRITSLPAAGTLTVNGFPLSPGQVVPVSSIASGQLRFIPAINASGLPYASFTFQVQDDGGTTNGGNDFDPSPNTLTINVTPVNDPPFGFNGTVTMAEDTLYAFNVADFGFIDFADAPPNSLLGVRITTLPAAGTLIVDGAPANFGQVVPVSSIASGQLRFIPGPNASGLPYASFTFQVQDDGGTANGGVDFDPSPNTLTINVTPVNDPPFGFNGTVTMAEDTLYALSVADFGFIDPFDAPPNSLLGVRITTLPAAGTLIVDGAPANFGQVVPVSSIASGQLRFIPGPNASGLPYASFTFQVQDDGGTANGGVDFDPSPNTLTINVTPVNDAPVGANGTVTMAEDTLYAFTVADFGFIDPQDVPPNSLQAVRITTLPTAGMLTVFGFPASPGQFVPVSLIVSGQMRFIPAINASGLPYASFTFQVQDDGGTANGGNDLDPSPNTLTINVTPVNDAPVAEDDSYSTSQGTPLTVPAAGVLENDSDVDGDSLSAALATGPSHGTVTLNSDGSFTYTPDSTFSGTDTFTYTLSDGNGGTDTATVSIDVAAAVPGSVVTIPDSCLGGTALLITGTSGNDSIVVTPGPGGTLTVTVNGVIHSVAAPSGRIIAFGGDGDDDIEVAGAVANSVWLYGDAGNDLLNAGNGGSLLIGGTGKDVLLGGGGRDIMIGGEGADTLTANGNDDILVAGLTNFDSRSTAGHEEFWCDVWSEWTSANSFVARVQNLRDGTGGNAHNNGSFLFPNVVDDLMAGSIDTLIGGAGSDWLLFEAGEDIVAGSAEANN